MAAWIVVGVVAGYLAGVVTMGLLVAIARGNEAARGQEGGRRADQPLLSEEMTRELIGRLMDVSLPPPREEPRGEDDRQPSHDPEYDPPLPEVGDWTDPFIGHERPNFLGVPAGGGVPGIDTPDLSPEEWRARGEAAFAGWAADGRAEVPSEAGSWVESITLDPEAD